MTLSDIKGKQIIRYSINKCFLQDFRTTFLVLLSCLKGEGERGRRGGEKKKKKEDKVYVLGQWGRYGCISCNIILFERYTHDIKKILYISILNLHALCKHGQHDLIILHEQNSAVPTVDYHKNLNLTIL
jgi:hypothetical protein